MKKLLLLLAALVLMLCGCSEETEPLPSIAASEAETVTVLEETVSVPAEPREQKENPYRLKTYTIETWFDGQQERNSTYEYVYNEKGWRVTENYSDDSVLVDTTLYEHDEYGNTVRSTFAKTDGTQTVWEYEYTLDDQHRPIYEKSYYNGTLSGITERAYDENGNLTDLDITRYTDGEPDITSWVTWIYNDNNDPIRQETLWDSGSGGYTLCEYQNGYLIREEVYDLEDVLTGYSTFSYDETGLVQTQLVYDADGTLGSKHIETFDSFGNTLTEEIYAYTDPFSQEPTAEWQRARYICTYELIDSAE